MANQSATGSRLRRSMAFAAAIGVAACVLLVWSRQDVVVGGPGHAVPTPTEATTPEPMRWNSVPSPLTPRTDAAVGWLDGRFYVVGGVPDCPASADCIALRDGAWFDPASATWRRIADAPDGLADTAGVAVGGDLFFATPDGTRSTRVLAYTPATDSWRTLPVLPASPRLIDAGGELLAVGQCTRTGGAGGVRRYDPSADGWQELSDDPLEVTLCRDFVWTDGTLLTTTGAAGRGELAAYDRTTGVWTRLDDFGGADGVPVAVGSRVVWLDVPAERIGSRLGPIYDAAARSWQVVAIDLEPGPFHGDGAVAGESVVYEGHLFDPVTFGTRAIPALPGGNTTGQTVAGGPGGILVVAGTSGRPGRTAAAFFLPTA